MQSLLYLTSLLCFAAAWEFHTIPVDQPSTPGWVQPSVQPSGGPVFASTPDWVQPSGGPIFASTQRPILFSTERPILFSTDGPVRPSGGPVFASTPNWVQPSGGPIFMSTPDWQPESVRPTGRPIEMSTPRIHEGSVGPSVPSDFSILPSVGPVRGSTPGTVGINTPPAILAALQRLRASRHY